jgi:lipoprotein-anchoring transpeptidase ErfK/SrfK
MRHEHTSPRKLIKLAAILMMAVAQASAEEKSAKAVKLDTLETRRIVVSITEHRLVLLDAGRIVKIYQTASGKPTTPSPSGEFMVASMVANPAYHAHGQDVEPGPKNPVGTRWIGLNTKGYGIHGTNAPNSIGKDASHGCIRMRNKDVEELFALVAVGVPVQLISGPLPIPAATPAVVQASTAAKPATVSATVGTGD